MENGNAKRVKDFTIRATIDNDTLRTCNMRCCHFFIFDKYKTSKIHKHGNSSINNTTTV